MIDVELEDPTTGRTPSDVRCFSNNGFGRGFVSMPAAILAVGQ